VPLSISAAFNKCRFQLVPNNGRLVTETEKTETPKPKLGRLFGAVIIGAIFGTYMAFGPVLLIKHRDPISVLHDQPTQRWLFYIVDAIGTALAFGVVYCRRAVTEKLGLKPLQAILAWLSRNRAAIVVALSIFLYKACAALCFKLGILPLPIKPIHPRSWLYIGLTMGAIGSLGLSASFLDGSMVNFFLGLPVSASRKKLLSASLAVLFYLISIPLLYSTYFPLLAIPGAFISLRWHLRQLSGATKGGVEEDLSKS
jgi:hypothetical protein